MKAIADVCLIPIGVGTSLSDYIAVCEKIFRKYSLIVNLHAYGTNLEGEWDDVFAAVKECHEAVHAEGAPRISTTIRVGTRNDRNQSMHDKIRSVEQKQHT